ncbi:hypothetical protein NDU88_002881 [Pleurodeles waltl]|uniref:Uncharacterized protein n=1 Tax=Pleurodeles waltl TaxID=8319 RepID=A0AAV7MRV0_PLEWA|nr:hypothetical protein NDU88_002881 [Pleurodeles waltl]
MGKRKPVDVPARQNGAKKSKKLTKNLVSPTTSKGSNPLDESDLLFKEVDYILNCNSHLPKKKSETLGVGKIPEIFAKKKKRSTTHSSLLISQSEASLAPKGKSTHMTVAISCSTPDAPLSHLDSLSTGITANPPPLSPEIVVIPNIQCTNRFGLLAEEGGLSACVAHVQHGVAIENNVPLNNDYASNGVQIPHEYVNLALVLQKVDEVKTLVVSLMGLLRENLVPKYGCSCKTTKKKVGIGGGLTAVPKLGSQSVIPPPKAAMNPFPLDPLLTHVESNQPEAARLRQKHTGVSNRRGARGGSLHCNTSLPRGR